MSQSQPLLTCDRLTYLTVNIMRACVVYVSVRGGGQRERKQDVLLIHCCSVSLHIFSVTPGTHTWPSDRTEAHTHTFGVHSWPFDGGS